MITCATKHGSIEYCFECAGYPCKKYSAPSKTDSFITYRNVIRDLSLARKDPGQYLRRLRQKQTILRELISRHDDGRSKGFYCLAVNLLPLSDSRVILKQARTLKEAGTTDIKERAEQIREAFRFHAGKHRIKLTLSRS